LEKLITIKLFGQEFTFKAESEVKKPKEVADILVKEVNKVENQFSDKMTISQLPILILAALNIANDNFELKRKYIDLLNNISDRSMHLICELNNRMQ